MYLLTIHVPIYVDGRLALVTTEWKRSLELLRDSFAGRFGDVAVLAPSLQRAAARPEQQLETLAPDAGLRLIPSFPRDCRAREFWTRHRARWIADIQAQLGSAQVVHAGFCDVYKPINFTGHLQAVRAGLPTVFVQDTDQVLQETELARGRGLPTRLRARAYCAVYERCVRRGVAQADLSLLKGRALHARYGRFARNAKDFQDTSYLASEIVSAARVEARLSSLGAERALRLSYCGRFEARKGVAESIALVDAARRAGARLELDLIGDGPQRAELGALAERLGAAAWLRFLGPKPYGPALLQELAGYDGLLFTPLAEDTPRMIFDGYAAGLPLLAFDIEYVRDCSARDGAALVLGSSDRAGAVRALVALDRDRARLAGLARKALAAARVHAADAWYRRRAEWTFEAVELRHKRS